MVPFPGGGHVTRAGCVSGTAGRGCLWLGQCHGSPAPGPWPGLAQRCRSTSCQTEPGPLRNLCLWRQRGSAQHGAGVQILCQRSEGFGSPSPGRYCLPSGTPAKQSARCWRANVPDLPLSDSPVGKLGNLLFPNLFSFSGIQSSLCFQYSKNLIQLLVHTCISLPAQQMPAKALIFHKKEDGAVPGAPAAACPPAEPRRAVTCSPVLPSLQPEPRPGVLPTPNRSQGERRSWGP